MDFQITNSLQKLCSSNGVNLRKWELADTPEYSIRKGASRICVIFKRLPFVAKACLRTENGENEAEREVYSAAKKRGIEKYFAKPFDTITIDNIEWMISEKIPCVGRMDLFDPKVGKLPDWIYDTDYYSMEYDGCDDWLYYAIEDEDFSALLDFLASCEIRDLHYNNFGWKENHICFIDYADIEGKRTDY